MGMSASQARYMMLSGRKSDVEFQGQQINQQRTTLATESSSITTQLLTMTVPNPPSSNDFTKTDYTFQLASNLCTISNLTLNPPAVPAVGPRYTVNFTYDTQEDTARKEVKSIAKDRVAQPDTGYYINGSKLKPVALPATPTAAERKLYDEDVARLKLIYGDQYTEPSTNYFKYETPTETYYISQGEITQAEEDAVTPTHPEGIAYSDDPAYKSTTQYRYVEEKADTLGYSTWNNAQVEWNDTGRMIRITDDLGNVYPLSLATTEDTAAYEDAMNEYEYQRDLYNQEMNRINAKIDIIESQDKKLELKLKNLDTQQEAINTELDAVKKVIDKNIENSFKAFG